MKQSTITFFPVGEKNGGITLLKLNDSEETTLMVDVSIEDEKIADHCDVATELRDRLKEDNEGRPYVDAFLLTHRHQDHLAGIQKHFHLGPLSEYPEAEDGEAPKIVIRELWSSTRYKKRASTSYELCEDAKAFNREMKRRVEAFRSKGCIQDEGDRATVVANDSDEEDIELISITRKVGTRFSTINCKELTPKFEAFILGPIEQQEDESDEDYEKKNRQSVILQIKVIEGAAYNRLLLAADAECFVWESLWSKYRSDLDKLSYDILLCPHHCSWHSLSYDSRSECDDPKVCGDAKLALSQCKKESGCIVSQSCVIKDDDNDPPSYAAKQEYLTIVSKKLFFCTNETPSEKKPEPLEFNLTASGPQRKAKKDKSKLSSAALASTREPLPHG
ncbi:MAG: metallohydrolase [Verrucomicrobiota bacterium]